MLMNSVLILSDAMGLQVLLKLSKGTVASVGCVGNIIVN